MENPLVQNNQNSQMPTMAIAALGIGAIAMMIALGPLGALLAVGAVVGATAVGAAVIKSKNLGISHDTQRMTKQVPERTSNVEQKTPEPIQLATKPTKLVDVTPIKQMSKEESKKWDDLIQETQVLTQTLLDKEKKPTETNTLGAAVVAKLERETEKKEDLDKRTPHEKLVSGMAELAIGKALLQMTTPPAQRLGPTTHGNDVPVKNPQPNGGLKFISSLFLTAAGRALIDQKPANERLAKWMGASLEKNEAKLAEEEKSLGVKISQSEIQEAIGTLSKYDAYYGKAGVTLGDHWPELITKAKEIVSPQKECNAFDGILNELTPDALKTLKSVKEQVKTEDHSVKTAEAPRLMSVPRDTAIDAAGMMR